MNTVFAFSALQFVSVCYTPHARIPYGHLYQEFSNDGSRYLFFCNTAEAARHSELKGWRFIRRPDPELSPKRLADLRFGDQLSTYGADVYPDMYSVARARKARRRVEHEVQEMNLEDEDGHADVD